jgi:hypothetical protein
MPRPPHLPRIDHSDSIWRRVQITMLLLMILLLPPFVSSPFVPDILLSTLFSNTLNPRDEVSQPYSATSKSIAFYIPISTFPDSIR